ncbi:ATP-binding protein [Candidatus Saccharibacteria bacterium]|nr:ATP-binding protein [Candidatus Saccharibacteria bacterium]
MTGSKQEYLPRIIDQEIKNKLSFFGAISIDGCKWCGKSTTAEQFSESFIKLQDPANKPMIEAALGQPNVILNGEKPRLIDEWQDFPEIWDAIRTDIDNTHLSGQYILTGSCTPRKSKPRHSGAGRIATVKMRPMTLYESKDSSGTVSLKSLFDGENEISGVSSYVIEDIAHLCARGGWPESVIKNPKNPTLVAREYIEAVVEREGGFEELEYYSPGRMRALLRSLSRGISEPAKISTVVTDVAQNTGATLSDVTVANYLAILEKIHIVDDVEAWSPKLRSKTDIRTSKKRNLVDPSLAVASLYATESDLLKDFNSFGLIFESLAMRDLRVYIEAMEGNLFYYRDKNGLECDAILHTVDGKWAGIEIKLGDGVDIIDTAAKQLLKFASLIDETETQKPVFLAVLSGTAKIAYRRPDGVFVIPIGCLGP